MWTYLGTITPRWEKWEFFPVSSINGTLLRVSFRSLDSLPLESMFSWLMLRRVWLTVTPPTRDRVKLVKPTDLAVVVEYPIQQSYLDAGLVVAEFQVKKGWKYKDRGRQEPAYQVTLEEQ